MKSKKNYGQVMEENHITAEKYRKNKQNNNNNFINTNLSSQNYWVFGLFSSPCILETRRHDVSETGSVSVLR
jgi:hypothetical protein